MISYVSILRHNNQKNKQFLYFSKLKYKIRLVLQSSANKSYQFMNKVSLMSKLKNDYLQNKMKLLSRNLMKIHKI
jgi:hypothetical protein